MSAINEDYFSEQILDEVACYWDNRADGYNQVNVEELNSHKRQLWQNVILQNAPDGQPLKVLDVGTGPGFFAVTLALAGQRVTAVDITSAMLEQAKHNAQEHQVNIDFVHSDVHCLPFQDNSFDLIVTRNVTWNLEYPYEAYKEWLRVLKPGGRLINFDANWYLQLFDPVYRQGYLRDRKNAQEMGIPDHYINTDTTAMENIARQLPLSRELRPHWDLCALLDVGFKKVTADTDVWQGLWSLEEKINYASTPMFMIVAQK